MLVELNNTLIETESIESLFVDEELKITKYFLYLKSGKYYVLEEDEFARLKEFLKPRKV